jgi:hypothetical protein
MPEPRARTSPSFAPAVPPTRGVALSIAFLAAALVVVAIAGAWTFIAHQQIRVAIATGAVENVDRARSVFDMMRTRTQESLRAQCRVLAEDPRLKATLATEGIDEATVADILSDLAKLRRGGVLMILSPEGRVFAQAGADELRGLDLSSSHVVQKARTSNEAIVGSWVIGKSIMDLSAIPMRSDDIVTAYLVVGQAVDQSIIKTVAESTGVETALGIGSELVFSSSQPASGMADVFAKIALEARSPHGQVTVKDARYVTGFIELEQSATRPYLVLARPLAPTEASFAAMRWLLWAPAGFVLLALLISRIRSKQLARMRSGGS